MESNLTVKAPTIHRARLAWSLYINYFIHGFGLIILAQNMTSLGAAWNSPLKIVSFVISGVGIGRLLSYLITGFLADLSSRKAFVLLGMSAYLAFAIGISFSHNIYVAYFFAILAGIANSALDEGFHVGWRVRLATAHRPTNGQRAMVWLVLYDHGRPGGHQLRLDLPPA